MTRGPAIDRSLNLRLLAFAGLAIASALIVAWLVLGLLFERHSERQLQAELERHGIAVIAALSIDAQGKPLLARRPADPRFDRPASGLYWRVRAPGGEIRSRSLWDGTLPAPPTLPTSGWTAFDARGSFEDRVLVVARTVQPGAAAPRALVEIAADRRPVAAARAAFGREAGVFLALLWAALALAAWVQVRLGLRPLARVERELAAMETSRDSRMAEDAHPVEVRPLTRAINRFADRRADDVAQARSRARDLAHALKTPITALRLQIDRLDPAARAEMAHSLALLSGAVEGELARTGASAVDRREQDATLAHAVVERLYAVVARTPDGEPLTFHNDLPADLAIPLSPEAAIEALGALIENAARHAQRRVKALGGTDEKDVWITICDDGPGIPANLRDQALSRGGRLDEQATRHGLGLSIARQFAEASGGRLELDDAALGGLCARLVWPMDVQPSA